MKPFSTPRPALRRLAFLLSVWLLAGWAVPAARAQAPVFTQAYVVGQPASGSTYTLSKMVVDPAGNVFLTGYFQGSVLLGSTLLTSAAPYPGPGNYAYPDLFVAKLNPAGQVLWAVRAGGPGDDRGYGISLDTLGHVFITGMAQGTARFGTLNLNNHPMQSPQVVVARLDAGSGAWQWLAQGGGNLTNRGAGIVADRAGHVFVAGETGDSGRGVYFDGLLQIRGSEDVFVAQLDAATGAWQWVELAGGATTTSKTNALAMDQAGNLYVSGEYRRGTLQFGALPALSAARQEDMFVAKLAVASRTWRWATAAGGPGNEYNYTLAVDEADHVVIGGEFWSASLSLGTTIFTNQSGRSQFGTLLPDAFAAGLDAASGAWRWAVQMGGPGLEVCNAAVIDAGGEVYLTGNFTGPTDFGGQIHVPASTVELYLVRLAAAGTWRGLAIGGGRGAKSGNALVLAGPGSLLLGGYMRGAVTDIGPVALAGSATEGWGFVSHLATPTSPLASQGAALALGGLSVWPSPARGQVWVRGAAAGTAVQVLDGVGRVVGAGVMPAGGTLALPLAPGLPAGLYLVRAGRLTRKLLVD